MALRLAISGFGRIGRMVLRALVESGRDDVEIVLINTPGPVDASAHLYEFDSVHGRAQGSFTHGDGWMDVGRGRIAMTHERDPSAIPHAAHGIDIVLECSGHFNTRDKAAAHLDGGARRVLVSAPCKSPDATIVYGVNHHEITSDMLVISNASCTTHGLAPVAHVMAESVGIEAGYMTTIHAYTGDQPTLDSSHKDLRRARAAAPACTQSTSRTAGRRPKNCTATIATSGCFRAARNSRQRRNRMGRHRAFHVLGFKHRPVGGAFQLPPRAPRLRHSRARAQG